MLSTDKLNEKIRSRAVNAAALADGLTRSGFSRQDAISAVKNWQRGLLKPIPQTEDIKRLADALGVQTTDISQWRASVRYAPTSPHKA
ncbi:MAG: hypothetical protein GWO86_03500, partial [Planctomycetes bacterium]|nr:hypothetical protein [Planctomycetota bacterium]